MKFLINQGQAIRSVFGRSRVTHFIPFSFPDGHAISGEGDIIAP
jgi:hypothetical protein